ncbi:hypothetical protein TSH100_03795 [Azospirillum sp. TSH100]|uniref:glycosyltransferase 87 family protein n=1 Tax=Azospirillum sp. TSH100 TaxID=652764 RepID=UPI000D60DB2E|nr:glycosyltransferase 87 family protein [Azospirillum sp. TSH100]PWC90115.1 hypothetical protein TSH100_03795 [Azospirillum sp. TSH100]QCG90679.1 DUF2029 domain-containing protein [Azospirillum sp. TSH100]
MNSNGILLSRVLHGGERRRGDASAWAVVIWCLFVVAMAVLAIIRPERPITHIYRNAVIDWWSAVPVYTEGIHGFLYFPSSAVLLGPLAALPLGLGDQIWRLAMVGVFSGAVYRVALLLHPNMGRTLAGWVLVAAIPTASINVLRGQCELMMMSVVLHAAVDLARGRDRRGAMMLALAVALKPLALVPALLFAAVRPGVRRPLGIGLLIAAAAPFLHPDPAYVAGQYAAMFGKLFTAAAPDSGRWFDLTRLLVEAGVQPAYATMTALRLSVALMVVGIAWMAVRRLDHVTGMIVTLMLGAWYLVLFNPRTEEGSYLSIAVLTTLAALVEHRRPRAGAVPMLLGLAVAGLGLHFYGGWLYRPTQMWLKQALTLALLGYPLWLVLTRRSLIANPVPAD